jgi:single-strand DNA-binding protein
MNSLNSILIEGNLTKDPVLSETPKGTSVCNFSVASNRFYKQEDELQKEVSFFDVEVWSRQAEVCAETLTKGRGVRVVGRLKQDRWTDEQGNPHARVKIVGEHVEFKPQFKKPDGSGEDGEEAVTEEQAEDIEESASVAEKV